MIFDGENYYTATITAGWTAEMWQQEYEKLRAEVKFEREYFDVLKCGFFLLVGIAFCLGVFVGTFL